MKKRNLLIAFDYYFTMLTNKEIAVKHGVSHTNISEISKKITKKQAWDFMQEHQAIPIYVDRDDFEAAMLALEFFEIKPRKMQNVLHN